MRQFPDHPPFSNAATASTPHSLRVPVELECLSFAPRLIVWATRAWWQDRGEATGSRDLIAQAFTLARCKGADIAFDELMLMALHGACRHLDIASSSTRLGRDEQAIIKVLAAFQDEAVIGGEKALEAWLPPATARLATDSALTLARQLGRAGLYVIPRNQN